MNVTTHQFFYCKTIFITNCNTFHPLSPCFLSHLHIKIVRKITKLMTEEKKEIIEPQELMFGKHFQMTIRIAMINIGTLVIIGGLGYYLDTILKTKPVFLIIGALLTFVVGQILVIQTIKLLTGIHKK